MSIEQHDDESAYSEYDGVYKKYWDSLTPRQKEIYHLLTLGKTISQIAQHFDIAPGTIRKHLRNIADRFEVEEKKKVRHWIWVEGKDDAHPSFQIPNEVSYQGTSIVIDVDGFILQRANDGHSLYPLKKLQKQLGNNYLKLYFLLWSGFSIDDVATITHYSSKTISYHINKLKSFFQSNTVFSSPIALCLHIKEESLNSITHLETWVESRRLQLTEEEQSVLQIISSYPYVEGTLTHKMVSTLLNTQLAGKYRDHYETRTVTNLIHNIAQKHQTDPNTFWYGIKNERSRV